MPDSLTAVTDAVTEPPRRPLESQLDLQRDLHHDLQLDLHIETQVKLAAELERCRRELEQVTLAYAAQRDSFDAIIDHLKLCMYLFDEQGYLRVANARFKRLFKLDPEDALPTLSISQFCGSLLEKLGALEGGHTRVEAFAALARSASKGSMNLLFQSGQVLQVTHSPLAAGGFVQTLEDVTDRRKAEARASHLASHDALTNLPNRRLLKQHIYVSINDAQANCAVLCVDLDRFKSVNDTLGHAGGDALLVEVAKRLQQCVRAADTVGRLGGDEFVIVNASGVGEQDLVLMAERVVTEMAKPFDILGQSVLIGASVGVAVAPRDGDSPDRLIKRADMALFEAKRDGRGRFRFFDPSLEARASERQTLENDLRIAVARGQFELYYQPYYAARQRKLIGFEALLRWNHPNRGMVSPLEFIPVAEELGLITELGDWILQEACRTAANWPDDVMVSVNVSARQFVNHDLFGSIQRALADSGLVPSRLEVEITESALMENIAVIESVLEKLRRQGVGLAMDDFGTGYSSLAYLRRFNFGKVKIDRSFISGLATENQAIAIVRAIIALCKNLNIVVTAEGVETELQADILRLENCDYLQGYYFARPTPTAKLAALFFAGEQPADESPEYLMK